MSITLDFKQATKLLEIFGGEPTLVTMLYSEGHSGEGLYAYYEDIPEEGSHFLGNPDSDAEPDVA